MTDEQIKEAEDLFTLAWRWDAKQHPVMHKLGETGLAVVYALKSEIADLECQRTESDLQYRGAVAAQRRLMARVKQLESKLRQRKGVAA